jgi:hypothetical protein
VKKSFQIGIPTQDPNPKNLKNKKPSSQQLSAAFGDEAASMLAPH